jgi:hypothetical protein
MPSNLSPWVKNPSTEHKATPEAWGSGQGEEVIRYLLIVIRFRLFPTHVSVHQPPEQANSALPDN